MLVMVSNQSNITFGYWSGKFPGSIGHLYSPGGQRGPWTWLPYALDNGAFTNLDIPAWRNLLRWAALSGVKPLWCAVPDSVGDREVTLEMYRAYAHEVVAYGFRPAFVAQDGMGFDDVPNEECMIFVGGGTEWKEASIVPWSKQFPGRVHVGRVNDSDRLWKCWNAGVSSVDGTGWFHKRQLGVLHKFIERTNA